MIFKTDKKISVIFGRRLKFQDTQETYGNENVDIGGVFLFDKQYRRAHPIRELHFFQEVFEYFQLIFDKT